MDSHVSETLGEVRSTGFACFCCGRPDPQISPTTNSPAGQNTYTDSIGVTAELFTPYRYNNSTQSCVLHAYTHKKCTKIQQQALYHLSKKKHLTAKWLKRFKAHFNAPAITPRSFAVKPGWYFGGAHVFEVQCGSAWATVSWESSYHFKSLHV